MKNGRVGRYFLEKIEFNQIKIMAKKIETYKDFKSYYGSISRPVIIFVGPPGCGKGTQSKILSEKTGYVHTSTGEILRASEDPEIKEMMKTGKLLPDELVGKGLEQFLKNHKYSDGFIFDGYPRNSQQKYLLEKILIKNGLEITNIFYINVPEDVLKERIKERAKESGRSDDKDPEVFNIRMKEYYDQTFPMIKSMRKYKNFLEINGTEDLEEVSDQIINNLDEI